MAHLFEQLQQSLAPRYRLERELGGGNMSTVYLAQDLEGGRTVALKVLHTDYAGGFAGERFLREIEIAARLQHPHIVPVLDSGQVAGALYLTMPFIEGESLRARIGREGRLPVSEVVRILADVADALDYAHRKGIVHRDIKPDNILLVGRHALVADFGVAKAVSAATVEPRHLTAGVAIGTPAYMAPEQATADPGQDHRVDLYALGVVGYELLAGHPPFEGATAQAVLTAHVLDDPVPVEEQREELPEVLAELIGRVLAKRPQERWQSASEMLHRLEPLSTPSGGMPPAATAPWHRRAPWWPWLAGVAGGLAALTAAVRLTIDAPAGAAPRPLAQQQLTFSGDLTAAVISPDGNLLAFVTHTAGRDYLMVQDLRGGAPLRLAEAAHIERLDWSGDATEVRYHVWEASGGSLQAVRRLGGEPRVLDPAFWSALSPDGSRLVSFPQGNNRMVLKDLRQGTTLSIATPGFYWHGLPVWSPAGDRIAYPANSPETGHAAMLLYTPGAAAIDTLFQSDVPCGTPAWNGAGDALYYLCGRGDISELRRLPLKPGRGGAAADARVLAAGLPITVEFDVQLSISRDGRHLVYLRHQDWSNLGLIPLAGRAAGAAPRLMTMGSANYQSAKFAPDGRAIAALRRGTDSVVVEVLSPGLRPARTVGKLLEAGELAWSPDGSTIAVAALGALRSAGIQMFPANGGPPMQRLPGEIGWSLSWEGPEIIIQAAGNRSFLALRPGGTAARRYQLRDTTGWVMAPRLAPDGRKLAYTWNTGQQRLGLYLAEEGAPARRLFEGLLVPLRWSRDGTVLYAGTWPLAVDSSRVYAVPADSSPARLLASFEGRVRPLDVSPDGRELLVNIVDSRVDAWLIPHPDSAAP